MTASEIKTQIDKVLESASPEVLESVLDYVKQLEMKRKNSLSRHLDKILEEDREVLEKLAK